MANVVGDNGSDSLEANVHAFFPLDDAFGLANKGLGGGGNASLTGTAALVASTVFFNREGYCDAPDSSNTVNFPSGAFPNRGTSDWTLDVWVYTSSYGGLSSVRRGMLRIPTVAQAGNEIEIRTTGAGDTIQIRVEASDGTAYEVSSSEGPDASGKAFVSICRSGNNLYYYHDGVLFNTADVTGKSFDFSGEDGGGPYSITSSAPDFRISELRFTNAARYDGTAYTTPTTPLVAPSTPRNREHWF